jgi:hypothetical protein
MRYVVICKKKYHFSCDYLTATDFFQFINKKNIIGIYQVKKNWHWAAETRTSDVSYEYQHSIINAIVFRNSFNWKIQKKTTIINTYIAI